VIEQTWWPVICEWGQFRARNISAQNSLVGVPTEPSESPYEGSGTVDCTRSVPTDVRQS
jgi:hypothetical protein